ncbi:hypothetical protein C4F49_16220 [Sphingobacterium sp. KB22]|uniref:Uncharacterized protein n=1 Tax=Sphingobacterium hungaricum TaxID=2082723 RepID=A0A928YSG6_9SPHI|nr:hypothetical protein [Sphingobacterium hungaricum]
MERLTAEWHIPLSPEGGTIMESKKIKKARCLCVFLVVFFMERLTAEWRREDTEFRGAGL